MKTTDELQREDDAAQLMATAIAFEKAGRNVPAHILRRLWGLRREWKKRTDVPAQVLAACRVLDGACARGAQ